MRLFLSPFAAIFAFAVLVRTSPPAAAQAPPGPVGPEGEPNRAQTWRVPTPDPGSVARAILSRPPGEGPFRLALIAHASTQNVPLRATMPQPDYRPLASFLVARGFAVLVPERPGHGGTGGNYVEDQQGCDEARYADAGRATAAEISAAANFSSLKRRQTRRIRTRSRPEGPIATTAGARKNAMMPKP